MTGLAQSATDTFKQIQQAHTKTTTETAKTAVDGFKQVTEGIEKTFQEMSKGLESQFQQHVKEVEKALRGALNDLPAVINEEAEKAAAQVDPKKELLKLVVIVAVVVVAALVVGPFAAGLLAPLGAMGTILAGAAVGALSGAVIQMASNAIDGKNLLEGVGQAALGGAIGGALGAGIGMAVGGALRGAAGNVANRLGERAGSGLRSAGNFALDVAEETIGDIATNIATGQFSWDSIGESLLFSVFGAGLSRSAAGQRISDGAQNRGTQISNNVSDRVRNAFGGSTGDRPNVDVNAPAKPPVAEETAPAKPPVAEETTPAKPPVAEETAPAKPPVAEETTPAKPPVAEETTPAKPPVAEETAPAKPPVAEETAPAKPPVAEETAPANRLTDAQLAETTTMPTRVGNEDHHVSFRRHGGRVELEVCSAACGNIKQKVQDVINDPRTTLELRKQLEALQQRVTTVEKGIENASMSHADVIQESGNIANEFRSIGESYPHVGEALNNPRIFEDTYEPRIEGDSGNYDRIRVDNLNVNSKQLEVKPRKIIDVDKFDSLRISEDADILYVLRDKNTGAVVKVGETSGEGYTSRFARYDYAAKQLGLELELEVTVVQGLDSDRSVRKQYETVLRERLEAVGHIQPWENVNRRLGRVGPGTPFDSLPASSAKQGRSPNLRDEGYDWGKEGTQKGYLLPPEGHTGGTLAPRTRRDAATTPKELAQFLKDNPNISKAEIARHFGVDEKSVRQWFKTEGWTSRLEELGVDITRWLPKEK
jgi:hypothetical protein